MTIDKSGSNKAALDDCNQGIEDDKTIEIRQIKYLSNIVEQDHRAVKRITRPMMGFKNFVCAAATLAGIEIAHMIKKGQSILKGILPTWEQFYALAG